MIGCAALRLRQAMRRRPLQQALRQRLLTFLTCRRGSQVPCGSDARPLDAAMSSQVSRMPRGPSSKHAALQ